jgi:hypothetical protein
MGGLIFCAILLLCFVPMFSRNARKRKKISDLRLTEATAEEIYALEEWKALMLKNALFADLAALLLALSFGFVQVAAPVVGVLIWTPLLFAGLSIYSRSKASEIKRGLPMLPKGYKWLSAKS